MSQRNIAFQSPPPDDWKPVYGELVFLCAKYVYARARVELVCDDLVRVRAQRMAPQLNGQKTNSTFMVRLNELRPIPPKM